MKVIHVSVECFPIAKVGGLADVVGALPKYLRNLKVDASVVMPWFDKPFLQKNKLKLVFESNFMQGSFNYFYQIFSLKKSVLGFPLYFIKIPDKLDRSEVYCYPDEAEQWLAFQHALLDWMCKAQIKPDILHCHDHHVGLIPFLIKNCEAFSLLKDVKTVITVHNGQYQGWMNWNKSMLFPAFDTWKWGLLDWDGVINPLATAIKCCDIYTTVSEGYLEELYVQANGLESLFSAEKAKSYGIVNGIDTSYWNPETDTLIPFKYNSKAIADGKRKNKKTLCKTFSLDSEKPLLCFIGRFAKEKGADLLPEIITELMLQNTKLSIFILGSGDKEIQEKLEEVSSKYKGKVAAYFGYNENLAHEVYAASDMLLMPSWVEPCGLNQLYALKYGTIPIVRNIGGLKDTVIDVEEKGGYGFKFNELSVDAAVKTIQRACDVFAQKRIWQNIRSKAMKLNFSWEKSAEKYLNLYKLKL